ncbi:MAG: aldo/keto reductase [Gammaproteobacteria bacterium]|nr:aldo/keto reductase [Gammaproteobacteria bacterium]
MKLRNIGSTKVSAEGLGCMGMSESYGTPDLEEARRTIKAAYRAGINFFDTADIYAYGDNEILVAEALKEFPRDSYFIATKGGILRDRVDPALRGVDNSPIYMISAVNASLARLKLDYIDLYYIHRIANGGKEIESSIAALAELVKAGKIRNIGLSEANEETIRKAHAIHPIAAVQTEYSLWRRDPETDGVMETCRELGITFIPYSPLGRGFLTGTIYPAELEKDDIRKALPRFQGENLKHNMEIVKGVQKMATEKGCTPAQLALAWVLAQGNNVIPIPGTKREKYLLENIAALDIDLTDEDLNRLDRIAPIGSAKGTRYTSASMKAFGFENDTDNAEEK